MTSDTNRASHNTRNLIISLAVLGVLLLSSTGDWAGPARIVFAICAGAMALGSAATILMGMGTPSEGFIGLLAVAVLGTSTIVLNLTWNNRAREADTVTASPIPTGGLPLRPKTFIAGPSPAKGAMPSGGPFGGSMPGSVGNSAAGPAPAPPSPEVQAAVKKIQDLVGRADETLKGGDNATAIPLLKEALVLFDKLPGPNLKRRGPIALALARAELALGELNGAVQALDDHLAKLAPFINKQPSEHDQSDTILHEDAAALLEETGVILGNAGRFEETLSRFQKSIALKEKYGAPAGDIVSTLSKLAISHGRLKNKPAAEEALARARKLLEETNPADKPGLDQLKAIAKEYGLKISH